jgi:hypothetical protein
VLAFLAGLALARAAYKVGRPRELFGGMEGARAYHGIEELVTLYIPFLFKTAFPAL